MSARKILVGNFLYYVAEGTTVDSVTASSSVKPDHSPSNNYTSLGDVEDVNLAPAITEEEVFSPLAAGGYGLSEVFNKTSKLSITATLQDMSEFLYQLLFLSTPLSSHAGVPLAASGRLKGWFYLVQRDQAGTQILTAEVWARAKVNGTKFGNNHAKGSIELDVLSNALNTLDTSGL